MRDLKRNKTLIHYALLVETVELIDEWDNKTGTFQNVYSPPIPLLINVSASKGEVETQPFGGEVSYDKILSCCDLSIPIDEFSIFWIETDDIAKPHNYITTKIAKSLNNVQIAVKRVEVSV